MDHLESGRYTASLPVQPAAQRPRGHRWRARIAGIPWQARMPATSPIGSAITESASSLDMSAQGAALPASACDRKRSIRVSAVMITLVRGWLSLLPVPGSCRVLRAGGRVRGRALLACGAAGVLDATARERIMPGGGQGALVVVVVKRFS